MTKTGLPSQRRRAPSSLSSAKLSGRKVTSPRGNMRVLVVEDHPAVARSLKAFLSLHRCEIEIAPSLHAALELAPEIEFDVLVCDLNLPDGTGWELMAKLGARARLRGVAYSALDQPYDIIQSQKAGFAEHVVKGSDPDELVAAIERVYAGKGRLAEKEWRSGNGDC